MVETIEDLCQESIAAALISATYNLSEMIKKVKEKNNDRSFNALDIVHRSKMTKLLTSEDMTQRSAAIVRRLNDI